MSTQSSATNKYGYGYTNAGAATGAVIGTMIAPGVGTLAGAAIGSAIGGVVGSIKSGNKAKKYMKKAQAVQQERESNAQAANYLQMIREARTTRAGSLASGVYSGLGYSSVLSDALSSIGSQSQYSIQYTANDQRLVELYNAYMKKAGAYSAAATTASKIGQLESMAFGAAATGVAAAGAGTAAGTSAAGVQAGEHTVLTAGQQAAYNTAYQQAYNQTMTRGLMYTNLGQKTLSSYGNSRQQSLRSY